MRFPSGLVAIKPEVAAIEQVETMETYHKIQTLYLRDPDTNFKTLLDGQFSKPEFEYLKDCIWVFTEKVDGTNIRVSLHNGKIMFAGKTYRAQIPPSLLSYLQNTFTELPGEDEICLYGEGFGGKIQKAGKLYANSPMFVLFDVYAGGIWLNRDSVEEIASSLHIPCAPIVGSGSLVYMAGIVKKGFRSRWGNFNAEGIVARPQVELLNRRGGRIITKLKCADFRT